MTQPASDDTPRVIMPMPDGTTFDGTVACLQGIMDEARVKAGEKGALSVAQIAADYGFNYTPAARQFARDYIAKAGGRS